MVPHGHTPREGHPHPSVSMHPRALAAASSRRLLALPMPLPLPLLLLPGARVVKAGLLVCPQEAEPRGCHARAARGRRQQRQRPPTAAATAPRRTKRSCSLAKLLGGLRCQCTAAQCDCHVPRGVAPPGQVQPGERRDKGVVMVGLPLKGRPLAQEFNSSPCILAHAQALPLPALQLSHLMRSSRQAPPRGAGSGPATVRVQPVLRMRPTGGGGGGGAGGCCWL